MHSFEIISIYILDILIGDPRWAPHPVRWIGRAVSWLEVFLRLLFRGPIMERIGGTFMALLLPTIVYFIASYIISLSFDLNFYAGLIATIYFGYTTIALGDLVKEAGSIEKRLRSDDLEGARSGLAGIVSRETFYLDKSSIIRGTIESVSENSSDGIIAPLFYMALGGVPLAMAYKAINTLDSMIGYKTERYLHFGWASARLDDLANYIPARITGLLIVIASFIMRFNPTGAFRIMLRDGKKHDSPNAGIPEAAMAGALGVQLGGPSVYFGVMEDKPAIGDPISALSLDHIRKAIKITYSVSFLMLVAIIILRMQN